MVLWDSIPQMCIIKWICSSSCWVISRKKCSCFKELQIGDMLVLIYVEESFWKETKRKFLIYKFSNNNKFEIVTGKIITIMWSFQSEIQGHEFDHIKYKNIKATFPVQISFKPDCPYLTIWFKARTNLILLIKHIIQIRYNWQMIWSYFSYQQDYGFCYLNSRNKKIMT